MVDAEGTEQYILHWPDHAASICQKFGGLFARQALVDVTLMCQDQTISVHKLVLASCSGVFEEMFLGEAPPPPDATLVVADVEFDILRAMIEFMYCGQTKIDHCQLQPLLNAAKGYKIADLESLVAPMIDARLPVELENLGDLDEETSQVNSSPEPKLVAIEALESPTSSFVFNDCQRVYMSHSKSFSNEESEEEENLETNETSEENSENSSKHISDCTNSEDSLRIDENFTVVEEMSTENLSETSRNISTNVRHEIDSEDNNSTENSPKNTEMRSDHENPCDSVKSTKKSLNSEIRVEATENTKLSNRKLSHSPEPETLSENSTESEELRAGPSKSLTEASGILTIIPELIQLPRTPGRSPTTSDSLDTPKTPEFSPSTTERLNGSDRRAETPKSLGKAPIHYSPDFIIKTPEHLPKTPDYHPKTPQYIVATPDESPEKLPDPVDNALDSPGSIGECHRVYTHKKRRTTHRQKFTSQSFMQIRESLPTECIDLSRDKDCDKSPITLPLIDLEADYMFALTPDSIQRETDICVDLDTDKFAVPDDRSLRQIKDLFSVENRIETTPVLRRSVRLNQLENDDRMNNNEGKVHDKKMNKSMKTERKIGKESRVSDENQKHVQTPKNTKKIVKNVKRKLTERNSKKVKEAKIESTESFPPASLNTIASVDRWLWGDLSDLPENAQDTAELPEYSPGEFIMFAVGLLPIRTALEKMQATPEHQPRKTRSSVAPKTDVGGFKRKFNGESETAVPSKKARENGADTVCHIQIRTSPQGCSSSSSSKRVHEDGLVGVESTSHKR